MYRVSAKAIIYNNKKEFLLFKDHNGIRDFPGGGIEFSETPTEAIVREVEEELGIKGAIVNDKIITFYKYYMEDVKLGIGMAYYEVELPKGAKIKTGDHECLEYGYFSINKCNELNLHNNVKGFIEYLSK